jgi:ATP-dependent RNA helicase DDX24/MAK5
MLETGHFAELENIVRLTMRQEKSVHRSSPKSEFHADLSASSPFPRTDDELQTEKDAPADSSADADNIPNMQTFVFSATLSRDLQQNLKKSRRRVADDPQKRKKSGKPSSTLGTCSICHLHCHHHHYVASVS